MHACGAQTSTKCDHSLIAGAPRASRLEESPADRLCRTALRDPSAFAPLDGEGPHQAFAPAAPLAVETVVDVVDDVLRAGLEEDEPGLVLLHRFRLFSGELRLRVHVLLALVRSVRHHLARGVRVETRELLVDADVGVVHIDGGRTAEVPDASVVDLSVRRCRAEERGRAERLGERLTTAQRRRLLLPGDRERRLAKAPGAEE